MPKKFPGISRNPWRHKGCNVIQQALFRISLLRHYGIELDDERVWHKLVDKLLIDFFPSYPAERLVGAPKELSPSDLFCVWADVELAKVVDGVKSDRAACRLLVDRMTFKPVRRQAYREPAEALRSRLRQARKDPELQELVEQMGIDWANKEDVSRAARYASEIRGHGHRTGGWP